MKTVKLIRNTSTEKGTFGVLVINDVPLCTTLELPWKDNQQNISCIPMGTYKVKRHTSPTKNRQTNHEVFYLQNVKNRSYVYIHIGNFTSDILGCILVGESYGTNCILQSVKAMKKILTELPKEDFILEIHNALF